MRVDRRRVDALDVIQRDGRIDEEAEHASAEHVPERHGDEEVDRPAVRVVFGGSGGAQVVDGFEADEGQGHDFQCGEDGAESDDRCGCACPIQMVEGADHAAAEVKGDAEVHGAKCEAGANHADPREQKRHEHGSKDLEEAFHPQVNDPPAPVLGIAQVASFAVKQAYHVEGGNGDGAIQKQVGDAASIFFVGKGGTNRTHDQHEPDDHADDEQHLPDASQFDVFVALVSEPEAFTTEGSFDGGVGATEGANDDHDDGG